MKEKRKKEIFREPHIDGWQKTVKYTHQGGKVESYIFAPTENKYDWPEILLVKKTTYKGVTSIKNMKTKVTGGFI